MQLGELRGILKSFLAKKLRIDYWGLGLPDSIYSQDKPASVGLDKPALDIVFNGSEGWGKDRTVVIETTIPFQIIYRFDASYKYQDLPRAEAESVLAQILFELQTPSCLNEDISSIEPSGSVSVAEHKNGDQLIIFELDIKTQFLSENSTILSGYFSNI
ncbi:MAG: hypothetical protein AB1589_18625 [Cyanobacteriota bacterium]